jgi:hypothetical protein
MEGEPVSEASVSCSLFDEADYPTEFVWTGTTMPTLGHLQELTDVPLE